MSAARLKTCLCADDKSLAGSGKTISDFLKGLDQIKKIPDYESALELKFVKALSK